MADLEEITRKVGREIAKLERFFETDVKPNTLRGTIEALRATAARLNELADDCEKRWAEPKQPVEKS